LGFVISAGTKFTQGGIVMMKIDTYWSAIGTAGLEHLDLLVSADGVKADGLVLRYHEGRGLRMRYELKCDAAWRAHELSVQMIEVGGANVSVSGDGEGNWFDYAGRSLDFLTGCVDVDVMATPFTNTLPIQRLDLIPGESKEIEVVYVTIPDLSVQRASQRYTCLEKGVETSRYLYESLGSDFKAELLVDENQLVVEYQGIWERAGFFKS
jgi:uncharacterized protein